MQKRRKQTDTGRNNDYSIWGVSWKYVPLGRHPSVRETTQKNKLE